MSQKYREYQNLDLTKTAEEIGAFWEEQNVFEKSLQNRENQEQFIFYEGPPSANGKPGIHHVMARAIKDIFCRYKTLKGFHVKRKAGWDTHGLPVEIGVEKMLGITKEDINNKASEKYISTQDYNATCRKEVMKYKDLWDDLTKKIGYWVNLDEPYITFDNKYIESVWFLLSELFKKDLLYKGHSIQPYSPAAGTGLSTHELNQPGCYRDVKDQTVVAQFKLVKNQTSDFLFSDVLGDLYFLAWTTTPWTLPSNTALAVGKNIVYQKVKTYNQYTNQPVTVILAKDLVSKYFPEKNKELNLEDYEKGQKNIPFEIVDELVGSKLENICYEQLLPYAQPTDGDAFRVVLGDFVTTEDGTGIVHIAPSFGADDYFVGQKNGLGSLTMVNKQGKFTDEMGEFAGRYVKNEYESDYNPAQNKDSVDLDIVVKLKNENKAFKTEKYVHSYPHCWRTDKPILYYPLDSWFIKTTAYRDRMIELNNTIQWKPESTGTGRFGNWLENLLDWNLSRSRFWGIPLPIWATKDKSEMICIGSVKELIEEIEKAVAKGVMKENPYQNFDTNSFTKQNYETIDLHRPFVDEIILVSKSGQKMYREPDLIDVWFDSGSMPYAQQHYPFENVEKFKEAFPADFIAEGVDQTRGWFFTLHAIAVMLFDSVAYKTCVSNGLVLDAKGQKMSKKLGNAIDPFKTIETYGADATRWYMITNSQPWNNLKFDLDGVDEVRRKLFGTLHNTYNFFALYANIDGFAYEENEIPYQNRPEIDRWILSELHSLIRKVDENYADYEPTKAGRLIANFVNEHLSNWYVRLSRRRFWKGTYSEDKISAYQTLYSCLLVVAKLISPISPFIADRIYGDLNEISQKEKHISVHLTDFPVANQKFIDTDLEERMELAQTISSLVLSLRKKTQIRVRQPLQKILIPVQNEGQKEKILKVQDLILSEVNVKEIEFVHESSDFFKKSAKANFKTLGPKYGKLMKDLSKAILSFTNQEINALESDGSYTLDIKGEELVLSPEDIEVHTNEIPGWATASQNKITVALDINISPELENEGIARELINRIQNMRKDFNFDVMDKIKVQIEKQEKLQEAVSENKDYICSETLAVSLNFVEKLNKNAVEIELNDEISVKIWIEKQ